mmetsp:Transcript_39780/g.119037  ORF Transcript_39780/g.119037 Transcript_39780/m.119037 type:complete len:276 (-) Transcript_39780:11-838(-)
MTVPSAAAVCGSPRQPPPPRASSRAATACLTTLSTENPMACPQQELGNIPIRHGDLRLLMAAGNVEPYHLRREQEGGRSRAQEELVAPAPGLEALICIHVPEEVTVQWLPEEVDIPAEEAAVHHRRGLQGLGHLVHRDAELLRLLLKATTGIECTVPYFQAALLQEAHSRMHVACLTLPLHVDLPVGKPRALLPQHLDGVPLQRGCEVEVCVDLEEVPALVEGRVQEEWARRVAGDAEVVGRPELCGILHPSMGGALHHAAGHAVHPANAAVGPK